MHYPSLIRTALCAVPLRMDLTGPGKTLLLPIFDYLFREDNPYQTVQVNGVTLRVNLWNPSERLLYYAPCNLLLSYRYSNLHLLMRRLHSEVGGVFVDIGANLGIHSLLARQLGLDTLLFEPEPLHYEFLHRNEHAFGRVMGCALSDTVGTGEFYVASKQNPGASSLVMSSRGWKRSGYERSIMVEVSTLDAALARLGVDPGLVRLIKIDVEGNEQYTLSGMAGYLARPDAAPVWCEVRGLGSDRGENNYIAIARYMAEFGYRAYGTEGRAVRPFDLASAPPRQVFDLLFLIPERHEALVNDITKVT